MFRLLLLLILCMTLITARRTVQRPATQANFGFLIPLGNMLTKIKTSVETVQYTISLKFTAAEWDVQAATLNRQFAKFEELNFFKNDQTFKESILSLTAPGFNSQKDFEATVNDILKFKQEDTDFTPQAPCQRTILELDKEDIQRGIQNINLQFERIDGNWELPGVKTDAVKLGVIFDFIDTYNEFFSEMEDNAGEILSSLELMSDNKFPEGVMRTNKTCKDSNAVKVTEGEIYKIISCQGSKEGYHCLTTVTQPMTLASYISNYAVNYRGYQLTGPSAAWRIIQSPETEQYQYARCLDEHSAHPSCILQDIPESCGTALMSKNNVNAIKNCNFTTKHDLESFVQMSDGGIFIQEAKTVSTGTDPVTAVQPYLLYSPKPVSITREGDEQVIIPSQKIEVLTVIESSLTEEDLDLLESLYEVDDFFENMDNEDYINIGLGAAQLLLIPFTIWSLWCVVKQRKTINQLMAAVQGPDRKMIYKKNYSRVQTK